jgi:hypothetical protein
MFNIDEAISQWRKQMSAGGRKSPISLRALDELESHLREALARTGTAIDQNTFNAAVRQLGDAQALRGEFKKVKRSSMKRKMTIAVGVFVFLMGIGMILPALGMHKQRNLAAIASGQNYFALNWTHDEISGLKGGFALTFAGIFVGVFALKRGQKPRLS